ncbi:SNF-related serine/threonine-protein kinase-like [Ornithodoros turicata]|uniref:SNF-related serine/threonine-protein kinase n=1 Tax=Ornithodoros turicata TaxID=34597 RepID=A0A2R5LL48_9ACAR
MSRWKNNNHYDPKVAGLYDLGDTLGRGHFAVVKLAKHVFTGEQVAVKVIDKTKLDDVSRAHLFQEVRCMKLVQHPNVVRLYEVIDTQTKLYLILEYGEGGDMYDYIMKHERGVDEQAARKYFRQIVHAIAYCHKLHVVHRDLKPENVVFFEKLEMVKLTDFGFSNKFCPGQKLETSCGSLAYSAPEILLGDSYDAPKVDVWSLGVILYMLVCGHAPFQEANDSETLTMIMDCKYTVPPYVSEECRRMIQRMLIRDPDKRATLEEMASDPWLTSGDSPEPAELLPLVHREHLSEDDHSHIIQKMVNGCIASKEEILEALDRNDYNHITATYFLLAERKLRAQRQEKALQLNRTSRADLSPVAVTPGVSSASQSPAKERVSIAPSLVSPSMTPSISLDGAAQEYSSLLSTPASTSSTVDNSSLMVPRSSLPLGRKCSIVREEDDLSALVPTTHSTPFDEEAEGAEESANSSRAVQPSLSLPVTAANSHLPAAGDNQSHRQSPTPRLRCAPGRRLHAVKSSPQLLGGLTEGRKLSGKLRSHGGCRSRNASCSSSDEDEDKRRTYHHVTAHGEGVSQGPSGPGSPGGGTASPRSTVAEEGYPADSTDSLDLLSEPQARLTNSVSCGDLTMEGGVSKDTSKGHTSALQCVDIVLVENKGDESVDTTPRISNSFSLAAGLSCLNQKSRRDGGSKGRLGCSLVRLVPNGTKTSGGATKSQLDINQNGWRGKGRSKNSARDVKMASKCCTLC